MAISSNLKEGSSFPIFNLKNHENIKITPSPVQTDLSHAPHGKGGGMNPILSILIDKLAFVAIVGGLAALPMVFLVGWRGWLGMAAILPFLALAWILATVI
jgi:hypothetical protein